MVKETGQETVPPISEAERKRRKKLVERLLKARDALPPLGISTVELVHMAREEHQPRGQG
jgi:hypothetical protein